MLDNILNTLPARKIIVLSGLQWGDEGKGKVSDSITKYFNTEPYVVVGPNGGGNAGHNVVIERSASTGEKIKLAFHELPGGAASADVVFLAQARIINFDNLLKEIAELQTHLPNQHRKIYIASRAVVNIPGGYNQIESVIEEAKGANKVGTTKQGIGPAYAGEALRTAITAGQLCALDETALRAKIAEICTTFPYLHPEEIATNLFAIKQNIAPMLADGSMEIVSDDFLTSSAVAGSHIIIEGSQSVGLGKFGGAYPNNTSSDCSLHGLLSSCLLPKADLVVGVAKATMSKVGGGRFASELEANGVPLKFVDQYREEAGEYGATTGRPRQVGFFDAVQMRHALKTGNAPDVLWVNMGDMLTLFAREGVVNKIVTGYRVTRHLVSGDGSEILLQDSIPLQEDVVEEIVYETMPEVADIDTDLATWVAALRSHINFSGPIVMGTGPEWDQNILFED